MVRCKGPTHVQAAWSRLIAARYAKAVGDTAICTLYDIRKAFDHLDWRAIMSAAKELGFPMMLLRFLLVLYGLTRYVVIGRGIVRESILVRSTVAGCTFADIIMFIVMRIVDDKVRKAAPHAHTAVVADDFQVLVTKPREQAIRITLAAHSAARKAFADAGLPIAANKQILLASDDKTAREVEGADSSLSGSRRKTARSLGIEFTLGKLRYTIVFAARAHKTKKKILKVKTMEKAGVDTSHYVVGLINSSHTYGSDCIGASWSQMQICIRAAHRAVTRSPMGRSATLDLALSRAEVTALDPRYRLNSGPIVALASALWEN